MNADLVMDSADVNQAKRNRYEKGVRGGEDVGIHKGESEVFELFRKDTSFRNVKSREIACGFKPAKPPRMPEIQDE